MRALKIRRILAAAAVVTVAGILGGTYLAGQTAPATNPLTPPLGGITVLATPPEGWFAAVPKLKLSTERVIIFKDGYGLIIKNGTATADADGRVFTNEVPDAAVLGTFWATTTDTQKLLGMRAEYDETKAVRKKTTPCLTVRDLLRANLGKSVTLGLEDKSEKRTAAGTLNVTGTITKMLEEPSDPAALGALQVPGAGAAYTYTPPKALPDFEQARMRISPYTGVPVEEGTITREMTPKGGDYVVIENAETGRLVVPVSQVVTVGGKDVVTEIGHEEEVLTRSKRLAFDFGKESAGKAVSLHLFYFTPGLRWIPTYRLSGDLKEKADLALQGEVLNDVEDVSGAALDLVVGVPNFRFKDAISPLSLEHQMRAALNAVEGNNRFNNQIILTQFRNNDNSGFVDAGRPAAPTGPAELGGSGEQDLFVYPLKDFSLRKGARASVPLWQTTAPLRHLYTYDVKARRSRSTGGMIKDYSTTAGSSPMQISINTIWHQLELKNDTTGPWTTGSALMLRESLPLGQDLLTYTPAGGSTLLPVTVAVDLRGTTDEEEIERHANALRVDGNDYALIKKKGTINLTSYRKEKSLMRITLCTGGKVESASDDGKIKLNDFRPEDWDESGWMRPNNHSDVVWEVDLESGKSKTLTYTISSYVH